MHRVLGLTSRPSQVGMEMPMPPVILSSDLHVFEPPDLWQTRIDAPFRDRAPRIQRIDGADQIDLERYLWQPAERRQVGQRSDEMLERLAVSRLTAFRRVTLPRRRSRRVFAAISNRSASGRIRNGSYGVSNRDKQTLVRGSWRRQIVTHARTRLAGGASKPSLIASCARVRHKQPL